MFENGSANLKAESNQAKGSVAANGKNNFPLVPYAWLPDIGISGRQLMVSNPTYRIDSCKQSSLYPPGISS